MLRGILRGVVVRWGSVIFIYVGDRRWYWFNLDALARRLQEAESQEETSRERENR